MILLSLISLLLLILLLLVSSNYSFSILLVLFIEKIDFAFYS